MIRLNNTKPGCFVIDYIRSRSDDVIHLHISPTNFTLDESNEQKHLLLEDPINAKTLMFSSLEEILKQYLLPLGIQNEFSSSLNEERLVDSLVRNRL